MNKKIILTTITCFWMILIFLFSNQEADNSTKISNSFMDNTVIKVYKAFDNDLTKEEENSIRETFFLPVRKMAHIFVYFVLGILVFLTLKEYKIEKNIIYYAILICFIYAITDEIHQLFINGRSGEFKDVLIDTLGSTIGVFSLKIKPSKKTK